MQARALGPGAGGNIQASFVTKKHGGGVVLISLTSEYNALLLSHMCVKTSWDDEVLHGAVVIGPPDRKLRRVPRGDPGAAGDTGDVPAAPTRRVSDRFA